MKRREGAGNKFFCLIVSVCVLVPTVVQAMPTTSYQAEQLVRNWLMMDQRPLDERMSLIVTKVVTYDDEEGSPLYHVVYLAGKGVVIVSGDDLVEPVIAFVPEAEEYINSEDNPLGSLVKNDVPGRIKSVRALAMQGVEMAAGEEKERALAAKRKWELFSGNDFISDLGSGIASISDVRVAPFINTRWDQTTEAAGNLCYNLYTPNQYPCGCVATAMSQIMRFFQFPISSVPAHTYTIYVYDDKAGKYIAQNGTMMGGVYDWQSMPYGPEISTLAERQAIAKLTRDTGYSLSMEYSAGGSGADTLDISDRLQDPFGYSNAVKGFNAGSNIETDERNNMVNPNLDAGRPVVLGITGSSGGHAIVTDGYGYDHDTLYHHLNMGWSGYENAWYNLPDVKGFYTFNSVYKTVYNIYTSGSGEIISGRITDSGGQPIEGVTVSAGGKSDVTDAKGIYAIEKLPSNAAYTVEAVKVGYTFSSVTIIVGTSVNYGTVGNVWGVDFVEEIPLENLATALDNMRLIWQTTGDADWQPQKEEFFYDGDAARSGSIGDNESTTLMTTVKGSGTVGFYWKSSSEKNYDLLSFYIDGKEKSSISGDTDWGYQEFEIEGEGLHSLQWIYRKDLSLSSYNDCSYVDKVMWTGKYSSSILQYLPPIVTAASKK